MNYCLRKSEVSVKEIQLVISLKIWPSMAYTVCHAPVLMPSYLCYCNSYDAMLMFSEDTEKTFCQGTKPTIL